MLITPERLKELINYDPETGAITWRNTIRGKIRGGEPAGSPHEGYWRLRIAGRVYRGQRIAWCYIHGIWPELIDHINGDPLDNRIANLRVATKAQNGANRGMNKNNKSGYKGVAYGKRDRRWGAYITVAGKSIGLGSYDTAEDAHAAYARAASRYFGEFACAG